MSKSESHGANGASHGTKRKRGNPSPLAVKKQKLLQSRQKLPIFTRANDIRSLLSKHKVLVLSGETGSGKSTQVPQFLLESKWCTGKIAVTQPRRVAAINLARRVAEEMGSPLGSSSPASKVGYSVRFDDNTSPSTRIKYLTEGMLLQELLRDAKLSQYSCVIIDEVHERSVNVDLLLGFLKALVYGQRKDSLRIVVMSATADVQGISNFFATPPELATQPSTAFDSVQPTDMVGVCQVEGRQFTVKTHYLDKPTETLSDAAVTRIFHIHIKEALPGDILVFMTGQESIQGLQKMVEDTAERLPNDVPKMLVLPLYAALPQEAQQRVFNPAPRFTRKVILATNIAETSVTVPGVRFVIDGGKSKVKRFHNTLGFESLVGKAISKSSADQRKGRAGREAPGQCYRLYTEKSYNEFEPQMSPEIQRSNLSSAVLAIKARDLDTSSGGFSDIHTFPFLTPPSEEALSRACLQLHLIGALDAKTGTITPLGRRIARLPLPPQLGRVVLEAAQPSRNCLREVIDIVSCLSVESIFLPAETEDARDAAAAARATLFRRSGDHMTLLATLQSYAAESGDRKRWAREHMCSHRALKAAMDVRKQLLSQCAAQRMLPKSTTTSSPEKEDILPPPSDHARIYDEATEGIILQCFLRGFVDHLARVYPDKAYRLMNGSNGGGGGGGSHVVAIHPSSVLFGRKLSAFMFNEVVFTTKAYLRAVSVIRLKWLDEILPPMGMAAAAAEGGGDGGGGAEVMEG